MTYREYLEKIKFCSLKTIQVYKKYAAILEQNDRDYKKVLLQSNDISTNTRRLMISAMKSYYKFLKDERFNELTLPKKKFVHKDYVSYDEYKNYLQLINRKTKMGYQKRIIVRLLFETGVRSSELLEIRKKDINDNCIYIFGKGKRNRIVKISKWLKEELDIYTIGIDTNLFNFGYKNLYKRVALLDKKRKLSPHMFRRGYAKYCYENNISVYDISLSMGHSSIETTVNYIKKSSMEVDIYKIF